MPRLVDGVKLVGRGGDRREADFVKSKVLFQMAEDAHDVGDAGGEGHTRGDRPRPVILDQRADLRLDDVVAAAAVGEDAELIVQLLAGRPC